MAVRLKDIAAACGVSTTVVSKVVNGGSSTVAMSEQTRQRVLEAAKRLGYVRNGASIALRGQRFQTVGLIMGGAEENYFLPQNMLAGLTQALAERHYTCTLAWAGNWLTDEAPDADTPGLPMLKNKLVDALVIAAVDDPTPLVQQTVDRLSVPVLWLHREAQHNCVAYDEGGAVDLLVDHLAGRGVDAITYLDHNGSRTETFSVRARLAAFHSACNRHGIKPRLVNEQRVERRDRARQFRGWLASTDRTRGVITDSATSAQICLDVAIADGHRVPDDLALATFDNGDRYDANAAPITAAIAPERSLGTTVAEVLTDLIEQPNQRIDSRRLPYRLVVGETT